MKDFTRARILVVGIYSVLFAYYGVSALLSLPYGLGWADQNKYLTRVLSRDNSSYYDFDHQFGRWISQNDRVATYDISGFYYANFDYRDVNYIFRSPNDSFDLLKKNQVKYLFLKGKKIEQFCREFKIRDCITEKYKLVAQYDPSPRYLYQIIK